MSGDTWSYNRRNNPQYTELFPRDLLYTRVPVNPRGNGNVTFWCVVQSAHAVLGLNNINLSPILRARPGSGRTGDVTLLGNAAIRRAVVHGTLQPSPHEVQNAIRNGLSEMGAFDAEVRAKLGKLGLLGPPYDRNHLVLFLNSDVVESWREEVFTKLSHSFGTEVRRHDEPVHISLGRVNIIPTDVQLEQIESAIRSKVPLGEIPLKGVIVG